MAHHTSVHAFQWAPKSHAVPENSLAQHVSQAVTVRPSLAVVPSTADNIEIALRTTMPPICYKPLACVCAHISFAHETKKKKPQKLNVVLDAI